MLKRLVVENFKPFHKVDIDFINLSGTLLVVGENKDAIGADSNEAGKSSIIDAIPWAIFGNVPGKVSADDVVRKGSNQAEVSLEIGDYRIVRARGRRNALELYYNNRDISLRTARMTQQNILEVFGFGAASATAFDDFFNSVYFSPGVVAVFSSQSMQSSDRIKLISRFLKVDKIDAARDLAKNKVKELSEGLTDLENEVKYLQGCISGIDEKELAKTIQEAEKSLNDCLRQRRSFDADYQCLVKIDKLRGKRQSTIDSETRFRDTIREQYRKTSRNISEIESNSDSISELKKKVANQVQIGQQYEALRQEIAKLDVEIAKLSSKIQLSKAIIECPECSAKLTLIDDELISVRAEESVKENELSKELERLEKKRQSVFSESRDIERLIDTSYERRLSVLLSVQDRLPELRKELNIIDRKGKDSKAREEKEVAILDSEISGLFEKTSGYDQNEILAKVAALDEQIGNLKSSINQAESSLKRYQEYSKQLESLEQQLVSNHKIIADYQTWVELFPEIKKNMILTFLPVLESRANSYLNSLGAGVNVIFDVDLARKVDEFRIFITEGNETWKFEERSRGMQSRIALALGLALGDIATFESSFQWGFRLFDEVVDSLDATGVDEFFNLMSTLPGQKIFISHDSDLKAKFDSDSIISVVKSNGIAKVEVNGVQR